MTIAIGYKCHNGVILAADTMAIVGHETYDGTKLELFWADSGSYAFVNSSEDAHATSALVDDIKHDIQNAKQIATYRDLGATIKKHMTEWRKAFGGRKPPQMQLLLGVKLKGVSGYPRLYFCEPPNTFKEIPEDDDYMAIGSGAGVTDVIYNYLFQHNGGYWCSPQAVLRRVAYLMYRAKKDSLLAGKRTHAAVVWRSEMEPTIVNHLDMEEAEKVSRSLDFLLSSTAILAIESTHETIEDNANGIAEMMKGMESIRSTEFHDEYGDLIDTKPRSQ